MGASFLDAMQGLTTSKVFGRSADDEGEKVAAALIGLALGDVGRAVLSWIFNALTQPVAALTASVLYFTLLHVRGAGETAQASG